MPEPREIEDMGMVTCTCSEEGRADRDALLARFAVEFVSGDDAVVSCAVAALNWDFDAYVSSIACDMWYAVTVEKYDHSYVVRVMCDDLESGFAWLWEHFEKRSKNE